MSVRTLLAAGLDHVVGAEAARDLLARLVARHRDDGAGAEALGGEHGRQAHRAVADDRHGAARRDSGRDRGVVSGGKHVRQRQQVGEQRLVDVTGDRHEGAVGPGHAHELGLAALVAAAVDTGGLDARRTVCAGVVAVEERGDHEVAGLDGRHGRADALDDADELVADLLGLADLVDASVGPQVRAADAGGHDADDRVGVVLQVGVGERVESDVAGGMKNGGSHGAILPASGTHRACDRIGT